MVKIVFHVLNSKLFKVLFILCTLVVAFFSLLPGKELPFGWIWDKALHFTGYAGLAFLAQMASTKRPFWLIAVACILFSSVLEIAQHFIPKRGFELEDIAANSLGVIAGIVLARLVKYLFYKES